MRVIECRTFGPPEGLAVAERPDPVAGPGQVLVRHRAWGLNYVDVLMCAGGYQLKPDLPFVPGLEPDRVSVCRSAARRRCLRLHRRSLHSSLRLRRTGGFRPLGRSYRRRPRLGQRPHEPPSGQFAAVLEALGGDGLGA